MSDWKAFTDAILAFSQARIEPVLKRRMAAAEDAAAKGRKSAPETLKWRSQPDPLFDRVFRGFTEILDTFEMLQDIEVYAGRFPFRGTRASKSRYLRHQVEAHFHELYIMRERLFTYASRLERLYRKTARASLASTRASVARDLVANTLAGVTATRGAHVHELRFSDPKLDELTGTELLANYSEEPMWKLMLSRQHREARHHWKGVIRKNNQAVHQLLDAYAKLLYPVLFDDQGKLIEPRRFGA
jgi:hypothetical protein